MVTLSLLLLIIIIIIINYISEEDWKTSEAPTLHAEPFFEKHYYQIRRIETFNPNQPLR